MTEIDLDRLEKLIAHADPTSSLDHKIVYAALRNAAPALIAAARERDELQGELGKTRADRVDRRIYDRVLKERNINHDCLNYAHADLTSLRALLAQAEGALEPFAFFPEEVWEDDIVDRQTVRIEIRGRSISSLMVEKFRRAQSTLAAIRQAKEPTT